MTTPQEMLEAIDTATRVAPRNGGLTLSDWEEGFVESITDVVDAGRVISEKQFACLEKIYDKT